ncbi:MAG: hypothetical protein CBC46_06695 [Verrucomicrobiaceae bacterium TMED86]|nr:MAG: hypothetical protein CBC46_06695 [Verrucomicrobiaceae bacterium TMED86]
MDHSKTFHINPVTDDNWRQAAKDLPEKITINGKEYKTKSLSENTKKLVMIYMSDTQIFRQFKELMALAELGLSAVNSEIEESIKNNPPTN